MKFIITGIIFSFLFSVHCFSQTICTDYSPKLSAITVSQLQQYESITTRGVNKNEFLFAYVRLIPQTDTNVLNEKYGVRLNTGAGGIYTAIIPMEQLRTFARDSTVMNIDASTEVRMMMDSVRIYTNIDPAFTGNGLSHSYQGEGTIIGIIDSGFDFTHPNFKDADGNFFHPKEVELAKKTLRAFAYSHVSGEVKSQLNAIAEAYGLEKDKKYESQPAHS